MKHYGVVSMGIKLPLIRKGDNLKQAILDNVNMSLIGDKDIIGITESIVARSQGNYVTVNELADEITEKMGHPKTITVTNCIYSRNRFAVILKAIALAAGEKVRVYMPTYDEVGNVVDNHPFTKMNYRELYKEIIESVGKEAVIIPWEYTLSSDDTDTIYCGLHNYDDIKKGFPNLFTLKDFCSDKCEYGLFGCNKSNDDLLKLFPNRSTQEFCEELKAEIKTITGRDVIVCVYGDGCFKDPVGGIWEFADPVTMPAYTDKELLDSSPKEIKLKAIIDEGNNDDTIEMLIMTKASQRQGDMGTTPRRYRDLLASLMDLTSGSGDKGTPVILIKNYFSNYTS